MRQNWSHELVADMHPKELDEFVRALHSPSGHPVYKSGHEVGVWTVRGVQKRSSSSPARGSDHVALRPHRECGRAHGKIAVHEPKPPLGSLGHSSWGIELTSEAGHRRRARRAASRVPARPGRALSVGHSAGAPTAMRNAPTRPRQPTTIGRGEGAIDEFAGRSPIKDSKGSTWH